MPESSEIFADHFGALGERWFVGLYPLIGELTKKINPPKETDPCYQLYFDFLGTAMDYLNLWPKSKKLAEIGKVLLGGKIIQPERVEKIALNFIQLQPMRGISVLEIGGPFAQVFHLLGAKEAVVVDPYGERWPYSPEREGYLVISERFVPEKPPQLLMGKQFDIVMSRQVLADGSGFVSLQDLSEEIQSKTRNFLSGCVSFTKPGGLNIHNGDYLDEPYPWEEQIGLKRLAETFAIGQTTVIFKKI